MEKYFEWKAKKFYTANELDSYIETIRKYLIGKTLDKIMVMGTLYTSIGLDDNENRCIKYAGEDEWFIEENCSKNPIQSVPTHQVALSLDEPLVLFFGNQHFEIEYSEFSNAQVAMNSLDYTEISNIDGHVAWQDVNKYYSKNIIGQKLSDIKIHHTRHPNEYVSHYRKNGEDMYDDIIFVFENGHQLEIASDIDYMSLYENPIWQKMQDFSKDQWYYLSKYNVENKKPSFAELITKSIPKENTDLKILVKLIYGIDLDIYFDSNDVSNLWIAESMNWIPNIFHFLESVIYSKEKECFYYCDEEGEDSFLYVNKINDNDIRFIHLSEQIYIGDGKNESDEYKTRQDVIIGKKEFVKIFYTSIMNAVNNITKKYLKEECWDELDEYKILKKGSEIIEKYLGNM